LIRRSRVELRPASPAHIGTIARRMREHDVAECAAFGHTPKQALRGALASSSIAFTAFADGRAEAMMGLVVTNALCGEGSPWMLGSEAIYDHPREMIRMGPRILALMADSTPSMSGLVGAGNARAIRLLRRWGFAVGDVSSARCGVSFVSFEKEPGDV
jgi:hypothetical protein